MAAYFLYLFVFVPVLAAYRGWALHLLWGWFIVPGFGIAPASIVALLGLSLMISILHPHPINMKDATKETSEAVIEEIAKSVSVTSIFLLFGWVLKFFM